MVESSLRLPVNNLHIAIDARLLCRPKTGIGFYLDNLLRALAVVDSANDYTLFNVSGEQCLPELLEYPSPRFRARAIRFPNNVFVRLFRDSSPPSRLLRLLSQQYDLVHEPGYEPLPFARRSVVTIHDMILFRRPQDYPARFAARYQRRVRESARNASQIIADSENTRQDIIDLLDISPEKVHTIHLGVDQQIFTREPSAETEASILATVGVTKPFLLSIGDLYARKNNISLIKAWARLPRSVQVSHQLVIAGAPKEDTVIDEINREIQDAGFADMICLPGYVDSAARQALMRRAQALLYPTLYEGFGLPPLEAMACGVPTICSNNSSIPEVVGDASLLISDSQNPEAWADAIVRILSDGELRRMYREKGLERIQSFTWEQTARQTLRVYERAARV